MRNTKVTVTVCEQSGMVAELILPEGESVTPAVIVLGGSDGGIGYARSVATRLAEQGYAALAVAYFKEAGLPKKLIEIPLEYFTAGLEWLSQQQRVDPNRIGIYGVSKGAEAALLVASRHENISAIVAVSPSDVVWEGINFQTKAPISSSWSENGKPLPFIPYDRTVRTRSVLEMYRRSRRSHGINPEAMIRVERLNGPVLFLSGAADGLWPSEEMADNAMARIAKVDFAHEKRHVCYRGAGHAIFPLFRWRDRVMVTLLFKIFGGSGGKTRQARADGWRQTLAFFENSLGVPRMK